jgi:hypothetical protein
MPAAVVVTQGGTSKHHAVEAAAAPPAAKLAHAGKESGYGIVKRCRGRRSSGLTIQRWYPAADGPCLLLGRLRGSASEPRRVRCFFWTIPEVQRSARHTVVELQEHSTGYAAIRHYLFPDFLSSRGRVRFVETNVVYRFSPPAGSTAARPARHTSGRSPWVFERHGRERRGDAVQARYSGRPQLRDDGGKADRICSGARRAGLRGRQVGTRRKAVRTLRLCSQPANARACRGRSGSPVRTKRGISDPGPRPELRPI